MRHRIIKDLVEQTRLELQKHHGCRKLVNIMVYDKDETVTILQYNFGDTKLTCIIYDEHTSTPNHTHNENTEGLNRVLKIAIVSFRTLSDSFTHFQIKSITKYTIYEYQTLPSHLTFF